MAGYDDLLNRAKELGIPINSGVYKPKDQAWSEIQISEWELHRRIIEEQRHRREHRLWIVAVAAMLAAFVSAIAAWWPVLVRF